MDRWRYQTLEYKVDGGIFSRMRIERNYLIELNKLGGEGWELTGIIPFTENQGRLARVHLILKKRE